MSKSKDPPDPFREIPPHHDDAVPRRDNVVALVGVQVLRFSAGLGVSVLLARWLGREGWGAYTFVATVIHVAGVLSNAGIHQLLPRDVARDPARAAGLVSQALRVTGACSLVALIPVVAYVAWRDPALAAAALAAGIALGLQSATNVYMAGFEGLRRMHRQLYGVAAGRATYLLATAIAVVAGAPLAAIFGAQALAFAATLGVFAWTWRNTVPPSPADGGTRDLLTRATPFAVFVAFSALQERVDVLFLEAWHGDGAVGLYRGATLLVINLPVAARILATAAYPRLARAALDGDGFDATVERVLRLLLASGLALGVGGAFVGAPLLTWALGPAYAEAGRLFARAAAVLPVVFVRTGLGMALSASDRERPRAVGMAVAAAANVALNLAVVPRWGPAGAVATTLASEALLLVLYARPLRETLARLRPGSVLVRTATPALALAGVLALPLPPLPAAIGATFLWLLVARATGAWSPRDVTALRAL